MPEIPDVIASETIASEWGNDIRDRTVQRYADSTERTADHSSPAVGDLSFIEATGDLDVYSSGAWRHVGGTPVGTVIMNASATAPPGWLVCNGQAVSRSTYAALFAAIGEVWGEGDGSTTFNVPDMRGRVPRGVAASGTGDELGETFGSDTHTHTGPSHTHSGPAHTHSVSGTTGAGGSHSHSLESGYAKWGHTATETQYRRVTTEEWSVNRNVGEVLIPNSVSAVTNVGTELGGNSGSGGSHSHSFSDTSTSSGTGNTGASGTAATGSSSTVQAGAAIHFLIKT